MKKFLFNTLFVVGIMKIFVGCECQSENIPDFVPPLTDRVVLVEEVTGVRCPGCPKGSAELARLKTLFGDNVVILAYHSAFLAAPTDESKYDFRTPEADEMESYLGGQRGKPAASFNRNIINEQLNLRFKSGSDEWQSLLSEQVNQSSPIYLNANVDYLETSNQAEIEVKIQPNRTLSGQYRLTAVIAESHILDAQFLPNSVTVEDYEHNHVFRKMVTALKGEILPSNLEEDLEYTFNYTVDLDDSWVAENLTVTYFVEELQSGSPFDVLQAGEKHIIE